MSHGRVKDRYILFKKKFWKRVWKCWKCLIHTKRPKWDFFEWISNTMICLILWDKCRLKSGGLLGKLEAAAGGSIMVLWMNEILLKKYATAMEPPLLSWAWIWGERKFCTILKFLKLDKLLNLCEIFECVWVALKFAVDQICPSWIPARFSGHSCSEAAAPIILLLTLSLLTTLRSLQATVSSSSFFFVPMMILFFKV